MNLVVLKMCMLCEEIVCVICLCVVNLKWFDGVKCYGYKGVVEFVVIVDYLYGYDVIVCVLFDY